MRRPPIVGTGNSTDPHVFRLGAYAVPTQTDNKASDNIPMKSFPAILLAAIAIIPAGCKNDNITSSSMADEEHYAYPEVPERFDICVADSSVPAYDHSMTRSLSSLNHEPRKGWADKEP